MIPEQLIKSRIAYYEAERKRVEHIPNDCVLGMDKTDYGNMIHELRYLLSQITKPLTESEQALLFDRPPKLNKE